MIFDPNGKNSEIILWGLLHKRDSFRFISSGFYDALNHQGLKVHWVDDNPRNAKFITKNSLVFGVDVASKFMPFVPGAKYVTLNISSETPIGKQLNKTNDWFLIQELTNRATGIKDRLGSVAKFDRDATTLFMPWGTPLSVEDFMTPEIDSSRSRIEYWVGAIWDDALGQGNRKAIENFRCALAKKGVKFKRVGGSRIRLGGLSEAKNAERVRASRLGAAVVGNWQKSNQYYPCRLFKAVSFGVPPTSNLDAKIIYGDTLLYSDNIAELVQMAFDESKTSRVERAREAQLLTRNYTYKASFERILRMVNNEW